MGIPTSTVRLIVVGGEFDLPEIELSGCVTFGRGRDVDIRVNHPLISRRHCQVECRDQSVYVKDLGSLNGTFVGNERVQSEVQLPPDGLLSMGALTFRAIYSILEDLEQEGASAEAGRDTVAAHPTVADTASEETVANPAESYPPKVDRNTIRGDA